jgi:ATP-dependent Clp protease, protease subunit
MTVPEFPPHPPEPGRPFGDRPPGGDWTERLNESLLRRRIVMVHGFLDTSAATTVAARLMTLETTGEEPVSLHLRVPDAELEAAFAVVDTLDGLAAPVHATAVGEVGGPALVILAAARRRQITPHAHLRLTEPSVRLEGTAGEVSAREEQYARLVDAYYFRLADVTGREVDELRADARAGRFFSAAEAVEYGLVGSIATGSAE